MYRQEFALGDAEDAAEVLALDADSPVSSDVFDCDGACLKTEDFIGADPDAVEHKYYAMGVGFVAEELPDGEVVLELVKIDVAGMGSVMGLFAFGKVVATIALEFVAHKRTSIERAE